MAWGREGLWLIVMVFSGRPIMSAIGNDEVFLGLLFSLYNVLGQQWCHMK